MRGQEGVKVRGLSVVRPVERGLRLMDEEYLGTLCILSSSRDWRYKESPALISDFPGEETGDKCFY